MEKQWVNLRVYGKGVQQDSPRAVILIFVLKIPAGMLTYKYLL